MEKNNHIYLRCLCNELETLVIEYKGQTSPKTGYRCILPVYKPKEQNQIRHFLVINFLRPLNSYWGSN